MPHAMPLRRRTLPGARCSVTEHGAWLWTCPDSNRGSSPCPGDRESLVARLRDLHADLVIGAVSERHALPLDDDHFQRMALSDIWYLALVTSNAENRQVGPLIKVRRRTTDK